MWFWKCWVSFCYLYAHIYSINNGDLLYGALQNSLIHSHSIFHVTTGLPCIPPVTGNRLMLFWGTCLHMLQNTSALSIQQKANKYSSLSLWMCLDTRMTLICALARHKTHVLVSHPEYEVDSCLYLMLLLIIPSFMLTEALQKSVFLYLLVFLLSYVFFKSMKVVGHNNPEWFSLTELSSGNDTRHEVSHSTHHKFWQENHQLTSCLLTLLHAFQMTSEFFGMCFYLLLQWVKVEC